MRFVYSQAGARATFLQAVEDLAPTVLIDLRDKVYAIRLADKSAGRRWRTALEAWAKRWNLNAPWCLEWAERSLGWLSQPEGPRWSPDWYEWIKTGPFAVEPFIHSIADRAGWVCLNRNFGLISGTSAWFRPPRSAVAS